MHRESAGGMTKAAWLSQRRRKGRRGHLASIAARGDRHARTKKAGRKRKEFGGGVVVRDGSVASRVDSPGNWTELHSEEHGRPYWFNASTGLTTWNDPKGIAKQRTMRTMGSKSDTTVTTVSIL